MKNLFKTLLIALSLILMSCGSKTTEEDQLKQINALQEALKGAGSVTEVIASLPSGCVGKTVDNHSDGIIIKCSNGDVFLGIDHALEFAINQGGFEGQELDHFSVEIGGELLSFARLASSEVACGGPHNLLRFTFLGAEQVPFDILIVELEPGTVNVHYNSLDNLGDALQLGLSCDPLESEIGQEG